MYRRRSYLAAFAAALGWASVAPAQTVTGLTGGGVSLVTFDAATPGTLVGSPVTVTGLTAGETLKSIDYRPLDGTLVGVGYNSSAGSASVYAINRTTGLATSINTLTLGAGLSRVTGDFNPSANALRIVTSAGTGNNLRVPNGGAGAAATDTDLTPAQPNFRTTAYSRNVAGGGPGGATTLYGIVRNTDTTATLVTQGSADFVTGSGTSPNTGAISSAAAITFSPTARAVNGFDIL